MSGRSVRGGIRRVERFAGRGERRVEAAPRPLAFPWRGFRGRGARNGRSKIPIAPERSWAIALGRRIRLLVPSAFGMLGVPMCVADEKPGRAKLLVFD